MVDSAPPAIQLNGSTEPTTMETAPPKTQETDSQHPPLSRNDTTFSKFSYMSVPPEGSILTGKQEHCKPTPIYSGTPRGSFTKLTDGQTSSASSSHHRPNMKSQNCLRPLLFSASVHLSIQMPVRLRQKTRNCPSFASYSSTMFETFHF